MKPYGNTPAQNSSCRAGCCTLGTIKTKYHPHVDKVYIRRSRKVARRLNRQAIKEAA